MPCGNKGILFRSFVPTEDGVLDRQTVALLAEMLDVLQDLFEVQLQAWTLAALTWR